MINERLTETIEKEGGGHLLAGSCGGLGEDRRRGLESRRVQRVEILLHVDEAVVVSDGAEDLCLSVHHVLIFKDLFDGYDVAGLNILGLINTNSAK